MNIHTICNSRNQIKSERNIEINIERLGRSEQFNTVIKFIAISSHSIVRSIVRKNSMTNLLPITYKES